MIGTDDHQAESAGRRRTPRLHLGRAAAVLLVLALAHAAAARALIVVRGTVLDPSGAPVPGAGVTVQGGASVPTDAAGRFSLELAAGEWRIRWAHPAYRAVERFPANSVPDRTPMGAAGIIQQEGGLNQFPGSFWIDDVAFLDSRSARSRRDQSFLHLLDIVLQAG